jgi:hypothetical protein
VLLQQGQEGLFSMPLRGLLRVFEEVAERAEQELSGEDAAKAEPQELCLALEAWSVGEDEFSRRVEELVQKLAAIEERQKARRRRATG